MSVQELAGTVQLCVGQYCGIEAAVHAMSSVFGEEATEGLFLADASNAFNRLNRGVCLRNVRHLCPALAPILINTYRHPAPLYVGGECILSREGTTQGDPLAMHMYAIGMMPLIRLAGGTGALQQWYADDASAIGRLDRLREWWGVLEEFGPRYGYFLNATKSMLVVKEAHLAEAERLFAGTNVSITSEGSRYLGAAVGTPQFVEAYARSKIDGWRAKVEKLAVIDQTQPQSAYCALTHALRSEWSFLCRCLDMPSSWLEPVELAVRNRLIPALTSVSPPNDSLRGVLAQPCRLGGVGIVDASTLCQQHQSSVLITSGLVNLIKNKEQHLGDELHLLRNRRNSIRQTTRESQRAVMAGLLESAPRHLVRSVELAKEKGASAWLTCRSLRKYGFALSKGEFRDGLCLRYGWDLLRLPSSCVCGKTTFIEHSLSCPFGGFPTIQHNEVRDITAALLREVAHNVSVEPRLTPLSGEQLRYRTANQDDQARLDVGVSGLWGSRFERTLIDVRVFNPYAPSNRASPLDTVYQRHEREKKRKYEEHVRHVEHASFLPAVLSASGGFGRSATALYKRIASLMADKHKEAYSKVMAYIRCRLCFALLRSAIMCVRGSRSIVASGSAAVVGPSASAAVAEARIGLV